MDHKDSPQDSEEAPWDLLPQHDPTSCSDWEESVLAEGRFGACFGPFCVFR